MGQQPFFFKANQPKKAPKVFLDLGSNVGQSIIAFLNWKQDKAIDYDVFCFEPNIEFLPEWLMNVLTLQEHFASINLIPAAVGCNTDDMLIEFDGWQLAKFGGVRSRDRLVQTFDFAKWFSLIVQKYSYVVLKMDIEGAEYDLIHELSNLALLRSIDVLFMEIHGHKRGYSQMQTDQLISVIYANGIAPYLWEADSESKKLLFDPNQEFARIVPSFSKERNTVDFHSLHSIVLERNTNSNLF